MPSRADHAPCSDDLPPEIEASLALDKQKRLARKAAKLAPSATGAAAEPAPAAAPTSSSSRPSIPSAHVSAFLSELGLDTPGLPSSSSDAPPREKAPLKADKVSITSAKERELAQSQREGRKERVRPSIARPTGGATRERERGGGAEKNTERVPEREGAMLPPPNPVRRTSSSTARPATATSRKEGQRAPAPQQQPSSTLDDILALAASPPVATEPLTSSRVLSSSRAANGAPPPSSTATAGASAAAGTDEDRVRAKKAALLAKARAARA